MLLLSNNAYLKRNVLKHSVKKNDINKHLTDNKRPKTELDEKFLSTATQVMKAHGFTSDRAISIELGYRPDFINRVRNGVQSAPPAAWDALLNKYPEARTISTTNVTSHGSGQTVGTVHGDNHYTLNDCEKERDTFKNEVEQLRLQLAAKDDIIAAKDALIASQAETLSLLRGGYTRPN